MAQRTPSISGSIINLVKLTLPSLPRARLDLKNVFLGFIPVQLTIASSLPSPK